MPFLDPNQIRNTFCDLTLFLTCSTVLNIPFIRHIGVLFDPKLLNEKHNSVTKTAYFHL